MWSPEEKLPHRAGRDLESDLSLRYLAPGAFTILPPGKQGPPPEPASVANKHRLTPTTRKHRNAAFSIIAEPGSNPGSRSPSPTGRVSPFRGRGFNPTGSRHASPLPSPPPGGRRYSPTRGHQAEYTKRSKIPTLSRRGSTAALFGDDPQTTKKSNLTKQLSQSLTSISPKRVAYKAPPSPRGAGRPSRVPAFQKLSPIAGSSPEPSPAQHRLNPQSSPSKIPRSRSQPPSTRMSPNASRTTTRAGSRNPSRNASRSGSRESSPTKLTPRVSYKNVKAKVNSFNAVKPKVPPKPQVPKSNDKQRLERKDSVVRANDNNEINHSNSTNKTTNNNNRISSSVSTNKNNKSNLDGGSNEKQKRTNRDQDMQDIEDGDEDATSTTGKSKSNVEIKKVESTPRLMDLLSPSTTAVVSSTTTTVTQPLKIEAKFDVGSRDDGDKADTSVYLPDARALSATSVSTAMNRMNDTVLDTKTLMKDSNLSSKLSPAASAVISLSSAGNSQRQEPGQGQQATTLNPNVTSSAALPPVETVKSTTTNEDGGGAGRGVGGGGTNSTSTNFPRQITSSSLNNNGVPVINSTKTVIVDVKPNNETTNTNGKTNVISPTRGVVGLTDALPKSANERIKEARTMVATDVQPIRITVQEKPSNTEVQSGNVRLPVSATNGINERPGLPPSQPPQEEPPATPEPPKGCCGRLAGRCKRKPKGEAQKHEKAKTPRAGLWCCAKNKKVDEVRVRINSEASSMEEEETRTLKWWQKMKCCRRNKVADTKTQRKDSWAERTESYTSESTKKSPKDACKKFLRTIFCLNLCSRRRRKEEEEAIRRRASMLSKKKSLTPPTQPEEPKSKLDAGLVEHTSLMKAAIPVLPVPLAWLCLILNVFLPGIGTIVSGFLCLCMGKARFSTNDGAKQRVGACIIDFFIGCGQLFTVLFCLVGWGWSIWWGVIMIKIAKKYRKIRRAEKAMEEDYPTPVVEENHLTRDPERGS